MDITNTTMIGGCARIAVAGLFFGSTDVRIAEKKISLSFSYCKSGFSIQDSRRINGLSIES